VQRYLRYVEYYRKFIGYNRFLRGLSNDEGRGKYYAFEYYKNYFHNYLGKDHKSLFQFFVQYNKMYLRYIFNHNKLIYVNLFRKNFAFYANKIQNKFFLTYYYNFLNYNVLLHTYKFFIRRRAKYQKRKFSCLQELVEYFNYLKRTLNLMMLFQYPKIFKRKTIHKNFSFITLNKYYEFILMGNTFNKFNLYEKYTLIHRNRKWNRMLYYNIKSHFAVKSLQTLSLTKIVKLTNNIDRKRYIEKYKSSCGSLVVDAFVSDYSKCFLNANECIYYDILTYYNILCKYRMQKYILFTPKHMLFLTEDIFHVYIDTSKPEPVDKIIWLTKTRFSGIE
jgi:hypothetical protein